MKYYAPNNASFLLPFKFDSTSLKIDLEKCMNFDFLKNYVPANYSGENYILPLRSVEGRLDFPSAVPNNPDAYKDTIALKNCLYFRKVIDSFLCKKEAIRLMNLPPGAIVNTHTDHNCGYEDGVFRIHIPIITNENVYFTLNKELLFMQPGEAWYANVNLPHGVSNKGITNRVHLVIDCIRNNWSDNLFKSVGYDFEQEKEVEEKFPKNTVLRIIEELELQKSPELKTIIEQFKIRQG